MPFARWLARLLLFVAMPTLAAGPTFPPAADALLKAHSISGAPATAMLSEREVVSRAKLDGRRYSILGAMVVHAGLTRSREVLTQFDRLAGNIPYIERSEWDASRKQLLIAGGIWKYHLQSLLQFEEKSPTRWEFRVIGGHFLGMRGALELESAGPGRTLALLSSALEADRFPPRWVIERGAEIVFAVTARRMRNWAEDPNYGQPRLKDPAQGLSKDFNEGAGLDIPQPRRRLGR